ncbi:expressed unknown protein [Seminavis robusta]|uniref:Uncharacterized protein n=1 Tax=Seminavis robusta TaxID=568900 RepID=A0A9N8HIL7_9STRA|nr:expressed unknown protein [Seminavis robusta]|eukprot:Sro794_g203370.1 n/a (249) ;mRNA; f:14550-15421
MRVVGVLLILAAVGRTCGRLQGPTHEIELTDAEDGTPLISPFEDENLLPEEEDPKEDPAQRSLFKIFGMKVGGSASGSASDSSDSADGKNETIFHTITNCESECDRDHGGKGIYVCRHTPPALFDGKPKVTKCIKPDRAIEHDSCGCCHYGCTPRCPCKCEVGRKAPKKKKKRSRRERMLGDSDSDEEPDHGWSMVMFNDPKWKICVPEESLDVLLLAGNAKCDWSCTHDHPDPPLKAPPPPGPPPPK